MVVPDSEVMSPGEVESPLQSGQHQSRNNAHNALLPQLGRQSSIYSLTLDEFQHTLCESGKNFGSMNMDEFLNSIWTAEENQAHAQVHPAAATNTSGTATSAAVATNNSGQFFTGNVNNTSGEQNMIVKQLSLPRQGSLTLPGPLSHKTVDQVWSEIQKTQHQHHPSNNNNNNVQIPGSAPRQPTYGEMTLEDFLVKAGVVREQNQLNAPVVAQQPPVQFGLYPNGNNRVSGPPPMIRPVMGGGGGGAAAISGYSPLIREAAGYAGAGKRGGAYQPPPPCYGGMVGNGGYAIGSPVSPVSSDGITTSQLDGGNQYGMDMGGMRGSRKRIIDGPVEKVVERRQRRMIKNRESAARSRARKQAYTVELEAELNMLKEENAQLKQALAEFERKRKQQFYEEMRMKALPKAQKAKEKLRVLRRSLSCPI